LTSTTTETDPQDTQTWLDISIMDYERLPLENDDCLECGQPKPSFYEKQIRILIEKLEHSQLQLSAMASECHALRKAMSELRFQVPSKRWALSSTVTIMLFLM
jgi:hypothetical protein